VDVEAQQAGAEQSNAASGSLSNGAGGDPQPPQQPGIVHRNATATSTGSQLELIPSSSLGPTASGKVDDKPTTASEASSEEVQIQPATYRDIAKYFGMLGWTAL
jgi:hypothetical protein